MLSFDRLVTESSTHSIFCVLGGSQQLNGQVVILEALPLLRNLLSRTEFVELNFLF